MKDKKQRGVCLDIPTIIEEAKKAKAVEKPKMTRDEFRKLINGTDPDPDKMIKLSWDTPTR